MRTILFLIFLNCATSDAQNQVHLFSGSGTPFMVYINEKPVHRTPQTHVIIRDVKTDTLLVKIDFSGRKSGLTLYLLDKGKSTTGKEFTYRVEPVKNGIHHRFMGIRALTDPGSPLVPDKPQK